MAYRLGGGWQFGERDPEASVAEEGSGTGAEACNGSFMPVHSVMLRFVGKHLVEQVFSNKCSLQGNEELWLISSFLRHCIA